MEIIKKEFVSHYHWSEKQGQKLKQLLSQKKTSKAVILGLINRKSRQCIYDLFNGRVTTIEREVLENICNYFQVKESYFYPCETVTALSEKDTKTLTTILNKV